MSLRGYFVAFILLYAFPIKSFASLGDPSYKSQVGWCGRVLRSYDKFTPAWVGTSDKPHKLEDLFFEDRLRRSSQGTKGFPREFALYVTRAESPEGAARYGKHFIPIARTGGGLGLLTRVSSGEYTEILNAFSKAGIKVQGHKVANANAYVELPVLQSLPYPEGRQVLEIAIGYRAEGLPPALTNQESLNGFEPVTLKELQAVIKRLHIYEYDIEVHSQEASRAFFDNALAIPKERREFAVKRGNADTADMDLYEIARNDFELLKRTSSIGASWEIEAGLGSRLVVIFTYQDSIEVVISYDGTKDLDLMRRHVNALRNFETLGHTTPLPMASHPRFPKHTGLMGYRIDFGDEPFVSRNRRIADVIRNLFDEDFITHLVRN